jgi:non-heme chloroperoxidase
MANDIQSGAAAQEALQSASRATRSASTFTTRDGVDIYFKDWGRGQPVVFCHGGPLGADSWESQMFHMANNGFRTVAHDRRGHMRSSQPWDGNDMDHYADDLAQLLELLDLNDVFLVGFSTGGGEVARYVGRHGTGRIARLALISAVPPLMVQRPDNPDGVPRAVFDGLRADQTANRSQLYMDIPAGPFYGFNRPGATPSPGLVQSWFLQGMLGGHKNTYDSIAAFSETDFREDLKKFDKPTLVIHGTDDQVVPIDVGGRASAKLIKGVTFIEYPGAPHGLTDTHKDEVNTHLLAFARGETIA